MTDVTNYRVIARAYGEEAFDVVHEDEHGRNGCGASLLFTQNVSVQTLVEAAHRHSLVCKKH